MGAGLLLPLTSRCQEPPGARGLEIKLKAAAPAGGRTHNSPAWAAAAAAAAPGSQRPRGGEGAQQARDTGRGKGEGVD